MRWNDLETNCELIWIELTITSTPTFIGVYYQSPNQNTFSIDELLRSLLCLPDNSLIYLCGDFNRPGITWNVQDVIGTTGTSKAKEDLSNVDKL